ncbi:unnamed protein product, partial [Polarella glacialis]
PRLRREEMERGTDFSPLTMFPVTLLRSVACVASVLSSTFWISKKRDAMRATTTRITANRVAMRAVQPRASSRSSRGQGFASKDSTAPGPGAKAFRLDEAPEKGKILVSTKGFSVGDVVFSEKAVWRVRLDAPAGQDVAPVQPQAILDSFYSLPARVRKEVLELYCMPGERSQMRFAFGASGERLSAASMRLPAESSVEEAWRVLRIYESSSVSPEGHTFASIYAHPSRMSHSCAPNACIRFSEHCDVKALQRIQPGDELTHSYLTPGDLAQPHMLRQ